MKKPACGRCNFQGDSRLGPSSAEILCLIDGTWHEDSYSCKHWSEYAYHLSNQQRAQLAIARKNEEDAERRHQETLEYLAKRDPPVNITVIQAQHQTQSQHQTQHATLLSPRERPIFREWFLKHIREIVVGAVVILVGGWLMFFLGPHDKVARPSQTALEVSDMQQLPEVEGVNIRNLKAGRDINIAINIRVQEQVPPSADMLFHIENRIFLYERYGGEWHTSNNEPILFTNDQTFLRNKFDAGRDYRFTPTIHNGSKTVTLMNPVQLYINLPKELKVKKPDLWVIASIDDEFTQYAASIHDNIPPGTGNTLNESLFIIFPGPGRYPATYSMHGTTSKGEGFSTDRRTLYFELTE